MRPHCDILSSRVLLHDILWQAHDFHLSNAILKYKQSNKTIHDKNDTLFTSLHNVKVQDYMLRYRFVKRLLELD